MTTIITATPKFLDEDDQGNKTNNDAKLEIRVLFYGLKVQTTVTLHVEHPAATTIADVDRSITEFCRSHASATAQIKLNFGGCSLSDPAETCVHAVERATRKSYAAAVASGNLPKLFVSGSFQVVSTDSSSSPSAAAAAASSSSSSSSVPAARRNRDGGGLLPEMSEEQANQMADMMVAMVQANPAFLEQDPQLREAMRNNPELRRQMQDPETLREMFRSQFGSRTTRQMEATSQAGALGQIAAHPEGQAMIENALGRMGFLDDDSRTGGPSIAEAEAQERSAGGGQQNGVDTPLLLPTANNNSAAAGMFGGGGPFGGMMMPTMPMPMPPQPSSNVDAAATRQQAVAKCVDSLKEMGFEEEISQLAAEEAVGDLDKALALIEEWQT